MSTWRKLLGPIVALALLLSMLPAAALAYNPVTCSPTENNPGHTAVTFRARTDNAVGAAITTVNVNTQFYIRATYTDIVEDATIVAAAAAANTFDGELILYVLLQHANGNWLGLYVTTAATVDDGGDADTAHEPTATYSASAYWRDFDAAAGAVQSFQVQLLPDAAGAGAERAVAAAVQSVSATGGGNEAIPAMLVHGVNVTSGIPAVNTAQTITVDWRVEIDAGQRAFPAGVLTLTGAAEDTESGPSVGGINAGGETCDQYVGEATSTLTITNAAPVVQSVIPKEGTLFTGAGNGMSFAVRATDANSDLRGVGLTLLRADGAWMFVAYRAGVEDAANADPDFDLPEFVEEAEGAEVDNYATVSEQTAYWTFTESSGIDLQGVAAAGATAALTGVYGSLSTDNSSVSGNGADATIIFSITFTPAFLGSVSLFSEASDFHGGVQLGTLNGIITISRP